MSCPAKTMPVPVESPSQPVVQESAVKELQVQHKAVVAALSAERQRPNIKQQQPSSSSSPMQRQFICYFCNEPGHIARPYCQALSKEATVSTFWRTTEAGAIQP
eukprot:gene3799-4324_t